MLEIQRIRMHKDAVIEGLKKRCFDAETIIAELLSEDEKWRLSKTEKENITSKMNQLSKQIGSLFKEGKQDEANRLKVKTAELKEKESELKKSVAVFEKKIADLMYQLPNVPNELVKKGQSEQENETIEEHGKHPKFDFTPAPHWELTDKYGIIDSFLR